MTIRRSLLAAALVVTALAAPAGPVDAGPPSGDLLPLSTTDDRRIVDSDGREVLLRGANVNSLGEYWQGDPAHQPTPASTPA